MHINNAKNVIIQVNLSYYKWRGDQVISHFASLPFRIVSGLVVMTFFGHRGMSSFIYCRVFSTIQLSDYTKIKWGVIYFPEYIFRSSQITERVYGWMTECNVKLFRILWTWKTQYQYRSFTNNLQQNVFRNRRKSAYCTTEGNFSTL